MSIQWAVKMFNNIIMGEFIIGHSLVPMTTDIHTFGDHSAVPCICRSWIEITGYYAPY